MRTKFLIFTILSFSACSVFVNAQGKLTRQTALSRIKKCSIKSTEFNCNEKNVEFLINLYKRGDKSLLNPLLDVSRKSDGALSELLGDFYADVLRNQTAEFLSALIKRTKKEQVRLAKQAIMADGSGNTKSWAIDTKRKLKHFALNKNNKFSSVAKMCLKELDNFSNN